MKKILITGGAGFIGSNLTGFFLKNNHQVWVLDNFITSSPQNISEYSNNPNYHFIRADLTKNRFSKHLGKQSFDIIYHLASPASPRQYIKYPIETILVNSLGTYYLLNYFRKTASKTFIYASTSEVYGDPKVHPQPESYWGNVNPVGIRSCYDEAKRIGETLCMTFFRQYDLDIRIARIFNTFGPNMEKDDGRVIANFIVQSLTGQSLTVYGNGQQTRSFCYIDDLINGLNALYQSNETRGQIINLGNADERKIITMAHLINKLTGSDSKIVFKPLPENDPEKRKPDLYRAKKLLHWQPKITLEDGLTLTIDYFKKRFNL